MSNKGKKFICIFDSSHFVDSEEKLIKHMAKCKAMEKDSYECCKFNPLHWVKYDTIKDHEESNHTAKLDCPDKNKTDQPKPQETSFSKWLPEQISRYEFYMPFEIDTSMIQTSSLASNNKTNKKQSKFQHEKIDPNSIHNRQKKAFQKVKKVQLWKEPDFEDFLKRKGYKKGKTQKRQHRNEPQSFLANNDSFLF